LGHVSLETTHRYAEITLKTNKPPSAACLPPVGISEAFRQSGDGRKDQDLMNGFARYDDYVATGTRTASIPQLRQ